MAARRRPRASKKNHTAAILLLTGVHTLLGAGCVSHREGSATRPLVAKDGGAKVSIARAALYGADFWIVVKVSGRSPPRVLGARLSAQSGSCRSGIPTKRVFESANEWVLAFDIADVRTVLARGAQLNVEISEPRRCLTLDLGSREVLFASSDIGIGGSLRYRDPGWVNAHYGHSLSGELGLDVWLDWTRLRASYEIGFAGCHGTRPEQLLGCATDDTLVPVVFGAYATHYFATQGSFTPAIGLGYQRQMIYGRDIATEPGEPHPDPVLHGPRFSFLVVGTPASVPRFEDAPPKTSSGFEISVDLLGTDSFVEPSLVIGLAWTTTAAF